MLHIIKKALLNLILNHQPPRSHFQQKTSEAALYLIYMDVEAQANWLEHCFTLNYHPSAQSLKWQKYKD